MTDFSRFVKGGVPFFSEKNGKEPQRTGCGGEKAVAFAGLAEYTIRDGHNREHDTMAHPAELPTVRLTSNRFWGGDFHFSIFTVRHTPESHPFQYCRNFWKIIYVLSGCGAEVIDGAGYALRPDTLFVIHPDDVTRFELAGDSEIEICNILFLPELIAFGVPFLADYPDFMRIFDPARKPEVGREQRERLYIQKADQSIAALVRAMLREFNQAQANYRSVIRLQLLELLCRIARQSDRKIRRSRGRAVAEQAADFLREHHSEPLEPAALAARFGVSRQYLHRVFSRTYGMSLGDALRDCRLTAAYRQLLEHPERTVSEVCYGCGFNDLSYFYRLFRARYGRAPGRLRG